MSNAVRTGPFIHDPDVRAHEMLQPRWYEQAGRNILGLNPTMPAPSPPHGSGHA